VSTSIRSSPRWRPASATSRARPAARKRRRHGRAGLPALRPERRRPLRQDGPQRHRIRNDGRLRRGLNVLQGANIGKQQHEIDAETTPLRDPEHYQYDLESADITEVWRRGSVIASWLLDLTAARWPRSAPLQVRRPRFGFRRGPLDDQGRDRRRRAGAGAHHRALRALQLARRGRLPVFPSEQLGKAFDHYDMARDGIADVTYVNPGYQPGRFPDRRGPIAVHLRRRQEGHAGARTSGTANTPPPR
jgi:hypothetical protein